MHNNSSWPGVAFLLNCRPLWSPNGTLPSRRSADATRCRPHVRYETECSRYDGNPRSSRFQWPKVGMFHLIPWTFPQPNHRRRTRSEDGTGVELVCSWVLLLPHPPSEGGYDAMKRWPVDWLGWGTMVINPFGSDSIPLVLPLTIFLVYERITIPISKEPTYK